MAAQSKNSRAYNAAHFALELVGQDNTPMKAGFFHSVEGGGIKSEIITYQGGSTTSLFRQLGKPKYEDIKIQVGMSMSEAFYKWIEKFFGGVTVRKDGAIVAGDFHYKERARREFTQAMISSIDMPKLDAEDKNACHMTVTLSPETIRFSKQNKNAVLGQFVGGQAQKLWTAANFKFFIDGLDGACERVTKIDGFSIKQKIHEYRAGNTRDAVRVPGILEFPNIVFYAPEADAEDFIDHFTKHVVEGKPQASTRCNGVIQLLDHLMKPLCEITLLGVDLAKVNPEKSEGSSDQIKLIKFEISVESMTFKYEKGSTDKGTATS